MKILISESEIQDRVRQLGSEISQDYNARMPTLVCVLKGSIIFFADVVRSITLDVTCEFVQISSYDDKSVSSGEANLVFNSKLNLTNTDVIIIEDIIDTGDIGICYATVNHGVDPVDIHKSPDWSAKDGRWFLSMYSNMSDEVGNRETLHAVK